MKTKKEGKREDEENDDVDGNKEGNGEGSEEDNMGDMEDDKTDGRKKERSASDQTHPTRASAKSVCRKKDKASHTTHCSRQLLSDSTKSSSRFSISSSTPNP
jgi:hypothetical protein